MYRKADSKDKEALISLWTRVFKDDTAYILRCLDDFAGWENIFVAELENKVSAMLLAVPCFLQTKPGVYLYALATEPLARKAGLMSGLMQFAEKAAKEAGAAFAVLVPATDLLYGYYEKRGYTHTLQVRRLVWQYTVTLQPAAQTNHAVLKLKQVPLTGAALASMRSEYLCVPFVAFDVGRMSVIAQDIKDGGALLAQCGEAYAVYEFTKELHVKELGALDDVSATHLLRALCAHTGSAQAVLTLPVCQKLFAGQGKPQRTALLKRFDPALDVEYAYIRFVMD